MKILITFVVGLLMLANFSFAQVITFDKTFDSLHEDKLVDVVQTSDGGYAAIGSTQGLSLSPPIANIYVIKYDQYGNTLWTKAIGGATWTYPGSIQQTSDGGYIICGRKLHTTKQAFIAKLSATGSIVWEKLVGIGNPSNIGDDWFSVAKQNPDGTFIAAGSTRSINNPDSTAYVYLVKFDAVGNTLWEKLTTQVLVEIMQGLTLKLLPVVVF